MKNEYLEKGATVSDCGAYRYRLWRVWDWGLPQMGVIMLNPSTADGSQDDPTIRKVVEFAKRLGFGSIDVCNLFAYRATMPAKLWAYAGVAGYGRPGGVVGPENDDAIRAMASRVDAILLAWGADARSDNRSMEVERRIVPSGATTFALKRTKHDRPWHPLYVPYSVTDDLREVLGARRDGRDENGGNRTNG